MTPKTPELASVAPVASPAPATTCTHCDREIVGHAITDEGDRFWLGYGDWRTWCSEDCRQNTAEAMAS